MQDRKVLDYLGSADTPPADENGLTDWIAGRDALDFLGASTAGRVPVCYLHPHFFVYGVVVPAAQVGQPDLDDLMGWNFPLSHGWTYSVHAGERGDVEAIVHQPGQVIGSEALKDAQPIVFLRRFARRAPEEEYVEVDQRLAHLLDAHWIAERQSYCGLNDSGDIVEVITIHKEDPHLLVTMEAKELQRYLAITNQVLVQLFDVRRCADWDNWEILRGADQKLEQRIDQGTLVADREEYWGEAGMDASLLRGFQLVAAPTSPDERRKLLLGESSGDDRSVRFHVLDLSRSEVREYPTNDARVDPLQPPDPISPAFFKPEVLDRFKADPDKYVLGPSSIECRGAWYLRSYDVNEEGQVYAYVKDLWALPYKEQQYWAWFNETPKAGITERSISQDFLARPWLGPDPWQDLRETLRSFPMATHDGSAVLIWGHKDADIGLLLSNFLPLHTESHKEWRDQILELCKVIVEGLQERKIRKVAQALGCDDPNWGSLKLLQACMQKRGVAANIVEQIYGPLRELNSHRSRGGVAHAGGKSESRDRRGAHSELMQQLAIAMESLAGLIRDGAFDLPVQSNCEQKTSVP
jgi:hypothetical protein